MSGAEVPDCEDWSHPELGLVGVERESADAFVLLVRVSPDFPAARLSLQLLAGASQTVELNNVPSHATLASDKFMFVVTEYNSLRMFPSQ